MKEFEVEFDSSAPIEVVYVSDITQIVTIIGITTIFSFGRFIRLKMIRTQV